MLGISLLFLLSYLNNLVIFVCIFLCYILLDWNGHIWFFLSHIQHGHLCSYLFICFTSLYWIGHLCYFFSFSHLYDLVVFVCISSCLISLYWSDYPWLQLFLYDIVVLYWWCSERSSLFVSLHVFILCLSNSIWLWSSLIGYSIFYESDTDH